MLKVNHNAGFFSCCNIRLHEIINYFNNNKKLPQIVDSSSQFVLYKPRDMIMNDITYHFFTNNNTMNIEFENSVSITNEKIEDQFSNYKKLNIEDTKPFIQKYFTPCQEIIDIQNKLLVKYNINPNKCISIYYRGTDKYLETVLGDFSKYDEMIYKIKDNNNTANNYTLLIQSDSSHFLNYMKEKHDNVIIIEENKSSNSNRGIHLHNTNIGNENYNDIKKLFASFLIISSCKHFICCSSNCSLWMVYYRGNIDNIHQYLINDFL